MTAPNRATPPWIYTVGFLVLFVGLAMTFVGSVELDSAVFADPTPRTLRCTQLAATGPGNNTHVTLTDFQLRWTGAVCEELAGNQRVFCVPLAPPTNDGTEPRSADVCAIIVQGARDWDDVRRQLSVYGLTGLLGHRGDFLGPRREALLQFNPGLNVDRCWMLSVGKKPWGIVDAALVIAIGVLLFSLGLYLMIQVEKPQTTPAMWLVCLVCAVMSGVHALIQKSRGHRTTLIAGLLGSGSLMVLLAALWAWQWQLFRPEGNVGGVALWMLLLDFGVAFLVLGIAFPHSDSAQELEKASDDTAGGDRRRREADEPN